MASPDSTEGTLVDLHPTGSHVETTVQTATRGLLGRPRSSEWLEDYGRPCTERETEEKCTLTAPAKVEMERPLPLLWALKLET